MGPRFPQGTAFRGATRSAAATATASASEEGSSSKRSKARKQQTSVLGHSSVPAGGAVHVPASRAQKESSGKSRLSASPAPPPQGRQQHKLERRQHVQKMQQQKTIHHRGEQQRRQQQLGEGGEQKEGHKQQQQHKMAVKLLSPDMENKRKKKRMERAGELQQQRQAAAARAEADAGDAAGVQGDEKEMKAKQMHKKEGGVALAAGEIAPKKQLLKRRRGSSVAAAVGTPSEATPNTGKGQQAQQRERLDASLVGGAAGVAREIAAAAEQHSTAAKGETTATGGTSAGARQCDEEAEKDPEREAEDTEEEQNADPYLLAEADYLRSETRWVNRQRVLVLSSRGISFLQRRLMEDFKRLLPHHKAEAKWEKKQTLRDIVELAQLRACNNVLFFESRKHDLLLHVAKLPHGPTAIFRVLNIHTLGEMRLTGNCLLHSRPLLLFDPVFDSETQPHWKLLKELFVQVFGTPRNHPKAKPFFDHAMGFFKFDGNKLWFRHYQSWNFREEGDTHQDTSGVLLPGVSVYLWTRRIAAARECVSLPPIAPLVPGSTGDANKPERQTFVEIGPRCVFEAVKILDDAFGGKTIWSNREFVPTRDMVALQRLQTAAEYAARVKAKERREERMDNIKGHEDRLSFENVFGEYVAENRRRPSKKQKVGVAC